MTAQDQYDAVIIGGGLSGIASAVRLRQDLGLQDVLIIERAPRFGGTWEWNTYPGAGCDVPTRLYSFSFAQRKDLDFFADQDALSKYIVEVADSFHLPEITLFRHEAQKAVYDSDSARWQVSIAPVQSSDTAQAQARTVSARVLVSGMGALSVPRSAELPGVDKFKGDIFHTARWDHSVDIRDKDVAIIGNGCSATQVVPEIAPIVKSVTQIARSKHWLSPRPVGGQHFSSKLSFLPGWHRFERILVYMTAESHWLQSDRKYGQAPRDHFAKICTDYMRRCAPPEYHSMLIPTQEELQVACKRRVFDNGYIPSLNRPNVTLTNRRTAAFDKDGIVFEDGSRIDADVVVLANGFASDTFALQMDIQGPNGTLADYWKQTGAPQAYRGTMAAGFPNFFMIWGPNTATGHFSALHTIESAAQLMTNVLKPVFPPSARSEWKALRSTVAPSPQAEDREQIYIQEEMNRKIYTSGCGSWYTKKTASGQERVVALAPCSQTVWALRCKFPVLSELEYTGLQESSTATSAKTKSNLAAYFLWTTRVGMALGLGRLPESDSERQRHSSLFKGVQGLLYALQMRMWYVAYVVLDAMSGWEKPDVEAVNAQKDRDAKLLLARMEANRKRV